MKSILIAICILITGSVTAQNYPFAKNFVAGTIILKDSTEKKGLIKWFPSPNEKLHFKPDGQDDAVKYTCNDLLGFKTDTLQFKTLYNISVYGETYALLNKMSFIRQSFAQVIYTGKINIYFILYFGYDAMQGGVVTYPNIIFEKTKNDQHEYAAYPVLIRMREKKYEQAKQNLYPFFSEYPAILEKLKLYNRDSDIFSLVNFIKQIPATQNEQ